MKTFEQWLETNTNIYVVNTKSWAGSASITFAINGKRYEYPIDPSWLANGSKFQNYLKYSPFKALNMAKQYGKPKAEPQTDKSKMVQKELF